MLTALSILELHLENPNSVDEKSPHDCKQTGPRSCSNWRKQPMKTENRVEKMFIRWIWIPRADNLSYRCFSSKQKPNGPEHFNYIGKELELCFILLIMKLPSGYQSHFKFCSRRLWCYLDTWVVNSSHFPVWGLQEVAYSWHNRGRRRQEYHHVYSLVLC